MATKTEIASNGKAYHVNNEKRTVKKVFHSLTELSEIKKQLKTAAKDSFQAFIKYLQEELPDEKITIRKDTFTIKGYRFTFTEAGITCKDLLNFAMPVTFGEAPTPRVIRDFLIPQKMDRKFSAAEMTAGVERGKKLLEERKEVALKTLPVITTTDDLLKQKEKVLRLIGRIRRKEADSKRLIEEVPTMINFHRVKVNLSRMCKKYQLGKMRFPKLLELVEKYIKEETFEPKKQPAEKFTGIEPMKFSRCLLTDKEELVVDGRTVNRCQWLLKYLLQRTSVPELMPQMMKWCTGEITDREWLDNPFVKDKFEEFEIGKLNILPDENEAGRFDTIIEMYYMVEEWLPYNIVCKNDDENLIRGTKVRVDFQDPPERLYGVVKNTEAGVYVLYENDVEQPLVKGLRYKIIK